MDGTVDATVTKALNKGYLLYTSDDADDLLSGDVRGARITIKKKTENNVNCALDPAAHNQLVRRR